MAGPAHPDSSLRDAAAPHPEEMRWAFDLRIGEAVSLQATARATPAGLVAAGLLVTAAVLPLVWLRRRR